MKRLFIAMLLMLPLLAVAKGDVDPKYLSGGVPEQNGVIIFEKTFNVPEKSADEIYATLFNHIQQDIVAKALPGQRSRIVSDGKEDKLIVAKVEEYMVFRHVFLNLDRTRFRYQISASIQGNSVKMQITQISYYYNEDQNAEHGINYKGEEWISDREALNKKGTKLLPRSGKFRIKTIDRVNDIFANAMNLFNKKGIVEN